MVRDVSLYHEYEQSVQTVEEARKAKKKGKITKSRAAKFNVQTLEGQENHNGVFNFDK